MRLVLPLIALVLLAGCTTLDFGTTWTKTGSGVPETSRDEWECRREVADAPRTPEMWIGGVADGYRLFDETEQRDQLLAQCMTGRGYQVARPDVWYRPMMLHWQ